MSNVHPNAPTQHQENKWLHLFRRPTHKQSIAIQTNTDRGPRHHGTKNWHLGACRNARILQTMMGNKP